MTGEDKSKRKTWTVVEEFCATKYRQFDFSAASSYENLESLFDWLAYSN